MEFFKALNIEPKEFVIFDLEFTSWPGAAQRNWDGEDEHREIIAIGAIRVDSSSLEIVDRFSRLVLPSLNSKLSPYISELTGISNRDIAQHGISFFEMLREFSVFTKACPCLNYGWDIVVMLENLLLNKANCKALFEASQKRFSLSLRGDLDEIGSEGELIYPAYGKPFTQIAELAKEGLTIEFESEIAASKIRAFNIRPWIIHQNPKLKGLTSGELAAEYCDKAQAHHAHDPLHDAESLHLVITHLCREV